MNTLLIIILALLIISSGSLIGVFTLAMSETKLSKILIFFVSLSAGAMMGGAFIHLLPEAGDSLGNQVYPILLFSFVFFFLVEKILHWRHCHQGHCHTHTFGYMNLVGDSIHNFIDGLIIAATFITDIRLGIITTMAVALHEIPQEIGDFGVLLYSGFTRKKALLANFLVSLTAVLGGLIGYWFYYQAPGLTIYLLPLAAGGFLYIAVSDLMPEIIKETNTKKSLISFVVFFAGILLMYLVKLLGVE